jgi:uncharacterized protein YgiM (DUF1202 family)
MGWFAIYETANRLMWTDAESVVIENTTLSGIVTSEALNMRDTPSANGVLIITLKKGDRITIIGDEQNGWFQVEIDGHRGFINSSYISIDGE